MEALIIRAIANIIPRLPIPIRFLIASRPETHISAAMNREFQNVFIERINLDEDQDIRTDLEAYYNDRFHDLCLNHPALKGQRQYSAWPPQSAIETLVRKSSTQFVYATTVMNYISYGRSHPAQRLKVILGVVLAPREDRPFLELDALYQIILLSVEESDRKMVRLLLTLIYYTGKRSEGSEMNLRSHTSPDLLEEYLGLEPGDAPRLLDPLVSLLRLPEKPSGKITMLHASFFDYFLDPIRSGNTGILSREDLKQRVALLVFNKLTKTAAWRRSGRECYSYYLHSVC